MGFKPEGANHYATMPPWALTVLNCSIGLCRISNVYKMKYIYIYILVFYIQIISSTSCWNLHLTVLCLSLSDPVIADAASSSPAADPSCECLHQLPADTCPLFTFILTLRFCLLVTCLVPLSRCDPITWLKVGVNIPCQHNTWRGSVLILEKLKQIRKYSSLPIINKPIPMLLP